MRCALLFSIICFQSWKLRYKATRYLNTYCTENLIYVFPEMKLCGLIPNSCIHESVSNLDIPSISLSIWLQQYRQADRSWEYIIAHRYMNVEIGRQNIIFLFWK
jgi:hypothetical protein